MNVKRKDNIFTHEGGPAKYISPEAQLRRSILACLLYEGEFYEDGKTIADRIIENAAKVSNETVASLAIEARNVHGLRHVPLILLLGLIKQGGKGVAQTIADTIRRPDEIAELVALYWNQNGKKMLSRQLRTGLRMAFEKFNEYSLAKYNRDDAIKLRDVAMLARVKPSAAERARLNAKLINKSYLPEKIFDEKAVKVPVGEGFEFSGLTTPDTWEVALSAGGDKRENFERLIREGKLGYLALLRNLRNMVDAGCDLELVKAAIVARKGAELVFPFRYTAAARAAPQLEPWIDQALCEAVATGPKLPGKTVVVVDVSGSMDWQMSAKSDMTRMDAAATLAAVIHGDLRMFSFSNDLVEIAPRRGMAGVDAIKSSQMHGGTNLGLAITRINAKAPSDRLIVITDEQSHDRVPDPVAKKAYMINVASARNGVGYGRWTHLDGFSEAIIRYITEIEADDRRSA